MPSEESYKEIEGEWKNFRFRRIQPADYQAVFDHIAGSFVRDEPTCKLLGWNEQFAEDVNRVVEYFLSHGMSFLAEDKETKKIAGARITFHHTPDITFDAIPLHSRNAQILLKFVDELEAKADVAKKHGISSWAEFFIASTSPDYRKMGLAGEFYDRSIKFLKAEGYKHALVAVTSPHTRHACTKRGFVQQSRMEMAELTDFEGKTVFNKDNLTEDHFALVMLKAL